MYNVKKYLKKFWIIILIFLGTLGLRIWALSLQPYVQYDEPSSFVVATSTNTFKNKKIKLTATDFDFKKNTQYNGGELQKVFFTPQNSLLDDLKYLRDVNIDRVHPTLYHSILRIWINNLGEFEYYKYLNHARILNLLFFIISFLIMYKLLKSIKNNDKFIALGLFFAFTNPGGIMQSTIAREYILMETTFILATYLSLNLAKKIIKNENIPYKILFLYPIGLSLFLQSGYFSVVYLSLILTILVGIGIYYKRWNSLVKILIIFVLTSLYTVICYPQYFNFSYQNEHWNDIKANLSPILFLSNLFEKISTMNEYMYLFFLNKINYWITILLSAMYILKPKSKFWGKEVFTKKELLTILAIYGTVIIWAIMVLSLQDFKISRYIMPAAGIYCLLLTALTYSCRKTIIITISLLTITYNISIFKYDNIMTYNRLRYINAVNFTTIPTNFKVGQDLPIIFVDIPNKFAIGNFLFTSVKNTDTIIFKDKIPDNNYSYKKFTLVTSQELPDRLSDINIPWGSNLFTLRVYYFDINK